MRRFSQNRGASFQQYAIMVGLVAIVALGAVTAAGYNVKTLLVNVSNRLENGGGGSVVSSGPAVCSAPQTIIVNAVAEATGSIAIPPNCGTVVISVWAAGGGSGIVQTGSSATLAGSGGVGGYTQATLSGVTGSTNLTYSIGTGGGITNNPGPTTAPGGTSSFGFGGGVGQNGPAQTAGGGAAAAVVRLAGTNLIVAGGGGGGGSAWVTGSNPKGGAGGGNAAGNGIYTAGGVAGAGGVYNTGSGSCTAGSGTTTGATGTSGGGSYGAAGGGGGGICGGGSVGYGDQAGGGGGAGYADSTRVTSITTTTRSVNGSNVPTSQLPSGAAVVSALSGVGLTPSDIGRGGVTPGLLQGEVGKPGLIVLDWSN